MIKCLDLAQQALEKGNSPFGALICDQDGKILAKGENTTNTHNHPVGHAEINALMQLAATEKERKFKDLVLISNVQSCPMCFCAVYRAGIHSFIYGSAENETLVPKITVQELNNHCTPQVLIITGVLNEKCEQFLLKARTRTT